MERFKVPGRVKNSPFIRRRAVKRLRRRLEKLMAEPLREGSRDFAIRLIAVRSGRFARNEKREKRGGEETARKNTSYYHR